MKYLLFLLTVFFMAGCTPKVPYTKVEGQFSQRVDIKRVERAILEAAKKEAWSLADHQLHRGGVVLRFEKVYKRRRAHALKPITRRGFHVKTIHIRVLVTRQGFGIDLTDEEGHHLQVKTVSQSVNEELTALKEAIYKGLTQMVLMDTSGGMEEK